MDKPPRDPHLTVMLRHELPDGSWHIDWLIALRPHALSPAPSPESGSDVRPPVLRSKAVAAETAAPPDLTGADDPLETASLMTFRASRRIDELAVGEGLDIQRSPDHRGTYLEYEGPISGGRGSVRRLIRGEIERWDPPIHGDPPRGEILIRWETDGSPSEQRLRLEQIDSTRWSVFCAGKTAVRPSTM